LHRRLDGDPHRLELPVRVPQLVEAPEPPCHVMHAGLGRGRRLAARQLEQGELVMLTAEAEKDSAALQVLVRDLEPERACVEVLRLAGVTDLENDVTELLRLNHRVLRAPVAPALAAMRQPTIPPGMPYLIALRAVACASIFRCRNQQNQPRY